MNKKIEAGTGSKADKCSTVGPLPEISGILSFGFLSRTLGHEFPRSGGSSVEEPKLPEIKKTA